MRKWCFVAVGLAVACSATLVSLAMLPPNSGVTKANFDRVKKGMTFAEVVEIFGKEPDERHGDLPPDTVKQMDDAKTAFKAMHAMLKDQGENVSPEVKQFIEDFEEQDKRIQELPISLHWIGENNSRAMFNAEGGRITEMVWINGSTFFGRFQQAIRWPWWE